MQASFMEQRQRYDSVLHAEYRADERGGMLATRKEADLGPIQSSMMDLLPKPAVIRAQPTAIRPQPTAIRPKPAVIRPKPAVIRPQPVAIVAPNVIRPVPLKVPKPIPTAATEEFYQAAYEQGIPGDAVHAAVMESHDWHRKWTQQDEEGHTMPPEPVTTRDDLEEDGGVLEATVPDFYAYNLLLDRGAGAKNPSPDEINKMRLDDEDEVVDRKRMRSSPERPHLVVPDEDDVEAALNLSPLTPEEDEESLQPAIKRPTVSQQPLQSSAVMAPPPTAAPAGLVRPVALRVSRPAAPQLGSSGAAAHAMMMNDPMYTAAIPRDILRNYSHLRPPSVLSVSPLTLASLGSSTQHHSRDSGSAGNRRILRHQASSSMLSSSGAMVSSLAVQQQNLHIIENDSEAGPPCLEILQPQSKHAHHHRPQHHRLRLRQEEIYSAVRRARDGVLEELAISGGETGSERFEACLQVLTEHFVCQEVDTSLSEHAEMTAGMWLTLTKPSYFGQLGENDGGDPLYTLGRMAFDMFAPTQLVCSLQGTFNSIQTVSRKDCRDLVERNVIPKSLLKDVLVAAQLEPEDQESSTPSTSLSGAAPPRASNDMVAPEKDDDASTSLRTYNVVAAFTIEPTLAAYPDAPNKDVRRPIRGIMTVYGYTLADPEEPNRQSVWITGGRIEPNDNPGDQAAWRRLFELHPPKHGFGEQAKLLAVKLLMGATIPKEMDADGSMNYTFTRPLGGHGMAYVDTLYVDESLRIVRGHRGTLFVFSLMTDYDKNNKKES